MILEQNDGQDSRHAKETRLSTEKKHPSTIM